MKASLKAWVACLALGAAASASAQQYNGIVKTNPLGMFAGQYMVGYEHMLNENMSIQVVPGLIHRTSDQNDSFGTYNNRYEQLKSGFIVVPEFRYYVSPDATGAPHGLYLAAFARVLSVNFDLDDVRDLEYTYYDDLLEMTLEGSADVSRDEQRTAIGGGITIGYAYYTSGGAMLEAFIGPQFKSVTYNRTYLSADIPSTEVGDEIFSQKYADFSLGSTENSGMGIRFGVNIGFGF